MTKRFAIIIESSNVYGQDDLPGARLDAVHLRSFLKSNLGGAWRNDEILQLSKPSSIDVKTQLILHDDCYIFLAFTGHGFAERNPFSTELITKVCLNDKEQAVDINEISPKQFGTAIFDCCRGIDNEEMYVEFANKGFSATRSTPLRRTSDSVWQWATNSAQQRSPVQEAIRDVFSQQIEKLRSFATVRMYACSLDESASEDPSAGGYYTTLLIQGAKIWKKKQKTNPHYAVYTTKQAHDFACEAMEEVNPSQHPEYSPPWQWYPFAIG